MENIDYSVVIRTTGKANEKYKKLLKSIYNLSPRPYEVIVVLPEGYSLPQQKLGWERFEFCKKGMVIQRLHGMNVCNTRYALFCDDDVEFNSDFVSKLYFPLSNLDLAFSTGPLYDFLPCGLRELIVTAISGSACPTLFHKRNYCTVLNTSGYAYNRRLNHTKIYYAQSMPWTCFFADVEKMRKVYMEDEIIWLDRNGYGAMDDLTMFYKAYLLGLRTIVVPEALYIHNDARTSSKNNQSNVTYALGFNRVVFWHRFLYSQKKSFFSKTWSKLCFRYNLLGRLIISFFTCLLRAQSVTGYKVFRKGYRDGFDYINDLEYKSLPNVWRKIE